MSVTLLRNSSRVFTTMAKGETLPILIKSSFTSVNNTRKTPHMLSNLPGYSSLKLTQWLQCQWRGHWTYSIWFWTFLILNLSDTEPIWYRTCQILNLSDTRLIRFWAFLIANLSDTEHIWYRFIWYRTYQIPNLPDTEPGRYWSRYQTCWFWTNKIPNLPDSKPIRF